jgi:hypothetical protein
MWGGLNNTWVVRQVGFQLELRTLKPGRKRAPGLTPSGGATDSRTGYKPDDD